MHVIQSIEAGASGYLLKDSSQEKLIEQIRSLCAGGSPISPLIARQILIRFRQDDKAAMHTSGQRANVVCSVLSERELEVLSLITKGFTYDEIAKIMHVSRNTVMTYVRRIYTKLEVKSRTEAINEARSQGLLTD
jgi:DNA-binding NarL/FixJ family response regulator